MLVQENFEKFLSNLTLDFLLLQYANRRSSKSQNSLLRPSTMATLKPMRKLLVCEVYFRFLFSHK